MLDLPKILDNDLIERVYPFLERDHDEFMQIYEDQEELHSDPNRTTSSFCNFEDFIVNSELPPFASEQVSYHVMQNFIDFHNSDQELLCEVILKDPYMTWDVHSFEEECEGMKQKKYEVEHSLIDFQKLIIGEKIRGYQEDFKNIRFTDQHLAAILYKEEEKQLHFYKLETVQKLVDFQFLKTKKFLTLIVKLYVLGFLAPFIIALTFDVVMLKYLCYIVCFVTQAFLFLFEVVQMR